MGTHLATLGTPLSTHMYPLVYAMATAGTGTGSGLSVGLTISRTRYRIPVLGHPAVYSGFGARLSLIRVLWKWQIQSGTLAI